MDADELEWTAMTIDSDAFRILLETVPDGFFVHDASGRFLDVNVRSCADLGYSREELLALTVNDISAGASPEDNARQWAEAPAGFAMSFGQIAVRKDGSHFPVEISVTCQAIDGRKLFFGVARDVTERVAAHMEIERQVAMRTAELQDTHERLALAARVGGLGIWDYDILRDAMECDPQWYRIMGRDPARPIRGIGEFRAFIHPEDADRATEIGETAARLVTASADYGIQFRIVRPDGELRWVRSVASVTVDGAGTPVRAVGFVVDVTDLQRATASLERQTREDPLTGVANRRHFDAEFERACLHAKRTGEPLTLAMVDVDHFKRYNDEHGHIAGDEALKAVAAILSQIARRPYDVVARYGGDEFLLLLPGLAEPQAILARIGEELTRLDLRRPASDVEPCLTVTCGCVVAMELADIDPPDLLDQCDRTLYRAKEDGRNRILISEI